MSEVTNYLFSYRYDGKEFGLVVPAYSLDEARGRIRAMVLSRYDGELVVRIPAFPTAGLFVRAIAAVRNFFARRP